MLVLALFSPQFRTLVLWIPPAFPVTKTSKFHLPPNSNLFLLKLIWVGVSLICNQMILRNTVQVFKEGKKRNDQENGISLIQGWQKQPCNSRQHLWGGRILNCMGCWSHKPEKLYLPVRETLKWNRQKFKKILVLRSNQWSFYFWKSTCTLLEYCFYGLEKVKLLCTEAKCGGSAFICTMFIARPTWEFYTICDNIKKYFSINSQ